MLRSWVTVNTLCMSVWAQVNKLGILQGNMFYCTGLAFALVFLKECCTEVCAHSCTRPYTCVGKCVCIYNPESMADVGDTCKPNSGSGKRSRSDLTSVPDYAKHPMLVTQATCSVALLRWGRERALLNTLEFMGKSSWESYLHGLNLIAAVCVSMHFIAVITDQVLYSFPIRQRNISWHPPSSYK